MKINESSFLLEFSTCLLQILATLLITFLFSHHIINLYQIQWLALPIIAWALLSSGTLKDDRSRWQGVVNIITFQLLLLLTFYGLSNLFGAGTFVATMKSTLFTLGFTPWGLMLVIALGLRLLHQASGKDASIVDILTRLIPFKKNSNFLTVLHLLIRGVTNFNIALTLALITISIYIALTGPLDPFAIRNLLLSIIFIVLIFSKPGKYLLKKTVQSARWLYITIPTYAIVLALVLSALAYALSSVATLHTKPPALIYLLNTAITTNSMRTLFSYGWWLAFASIGGVFIAHHSRSLTVRQLIVVSSILPLIVGACLQSSQIDSLLSTHQWSLIVAIIGISGLLKLVTDKNMLPCLILAYLPQTPHQFLFVSNLKTMLMILFFSIPIGLVTVSFFCCFISIPITLFSIVIIAAVGLLLRHEHNTL